jgi:xanthine dehydrogenase accessory factor
MIVRPDGAFHGTIGGGQLEWQMLRRAGEALAEGTRGAQWIDQALGPDLGQCCGGRVTVLLETFTREDEPELRALALQEEDGRFAVECRIEGERVRRMVLGRNGATASPDASWRESYGDILTSLYLFGAGHVGRALILGLAPLPFGVRWIDTREDAFPTHIPSNVTPVRSSDPVGELDRAPAASFVLIMTHDHPLDLAITAAALRRDFPYVGLIGSDTKRARFEKRFRELAIHERRIRELVCPIGLPGIGGKEPAVIAASTVAQLLQVREKLNGPVLPRHEDADLTV